jgi:hypothetical protein
MQARLIVPTYDSNVIRFPLTAIDGIRQQLIELCGGYTEIEGCGGYHSPSGRIFREPVIVFDLDYTSDNISIALRGLARTICEQLGQEAVYLRIGSEMRFVTK